MYPIAVKPSKIHGRGLHALKEFKAHKPICLAFKNKTQSVFARYVNDAGDLANSRPVLVDGNIWLVSNRYINKGEEITANYAIWSRILPDLNIKTYAKPST